MRQDFHIILISLLPVPELAHPLEIEPVVEETPAQKNFNTRAPKMTDYMRKRSTEKTTSETSDTDHPLDMKAYRLLTRLYKSLKLLWRT